MPAAPPTVKVKVTVVPTSPATGMYTALAKLESLNVPPPVVVHIKLSAPPPITPASVTAVSAHTS